ncbi:calcium-binding protein [Actinoplanes awajinensis]|uniref:Calcium-binding protein n=1 Tax=Actinoplanes awajinensis subsp. mycoplanecinus TaxID=135947 RepID=A0A0X3US45_9ACTN|nr:calcium-binding protein [Actinoplanes awajinensis]KUL34622.1 hypothetical protein ADL15_16285 [Actinoplanes awajinensis subsp. mycoplanecinus]
MVTRSGRTVTIDDKYAIKPGKGCKRVDATKVRCTTKTTPMLITVQLGTKNDRFVNKTAIRSWVRGQSGNDTLYGGPSEDFLDGGLNNDTLIGGAGDDGLAGWSGDDLLYGGSGRDWLDGKTGNDRLYGGTYGDRLQGGPGNDLIDGGSGNDFLAGENEDRGLAGPFPVGSDVFRGGAGRDTVTYESHQHGVTVDLDGQSGDDGEPGEHDTVGADVENIYGSMNDDTLIGNAAANEIWGTYGADTIRGGAGNDSLNGNFGLDKLYGEAGDDALDAIEPGTAAQHQQADQVDGGDNATSNGDLCKISAVDVVTTCERVEKL